MAAGWFGAMDTRKIVVAEILRPRGTRGELLAHSQTDVPDRLPSLKRANAALADGSDVPIEIERAWPHKNGWVIKLAGVDSIEASEHFRGAEVWVPFSERAGLPEGEFFRTDLIGCAVQDGATGNCIGEVTGWQQYGGPPLMEVRVNGRDVLIPFVNSICRQVDLDTRKIRVDLPQGLLDL